MKHLIYSVLWLFIGLTSAYDAYLNLRYPVTAQVEENPIAKWILQASGDDVPLLIGLKFAGTLACLGVLVLVYLHKKASAMLIASTVASVQGMVLWYLTDGFQFFG